MHKPSWTTIRDTGSRRKVRILVSLALSGSLLLPACFFRKHTAPSAPKVSAPVRIAFLPMNVPQGNADLLWLSMGTTVLMVGTARSAPDLEPVSLWESLPAALQSLGTSRTVTSDIAELTATRLSARWAAEGQLQAASNSVSLRIDFIPSQPSLVPFRYEKPGTPEQMPPRIQEAYEQFLRYLIVRPLDEQKNKPFDLKRLKEIADAVDAEYGWFATAKPGAAGKLVEDLSKSDPGFAKLLFSPTLYPVLGK